MPIKTQERVIPYIQSLGRGTSLEPMSVKRHGLGDQTLGTIPGRGVLFGRDEFGRPESKVEFDEPPSGLNTATITFDPEASLDFLDTMKIENGLFGVWNFYIPAGRLGNYLNWANNGSLDFLAGCKISGGSQGGREKDFSGQPLVNTYDISWRKTLQLLPPKITDLSPTAAVTVEDINAVTFISDLDPNQDIPGYPGSDKIGFAFPDAATGVAPEVFYTINGGSVWAALASDPFAADEHIKAGSVRFITHNTYRVVALRDTVDAAAPPSISSTDILLGAEGGAITWTEVNVGTTNNDPGEAMNWQIYGRMYLAAGGDIFLSTDQGLTVDATALFAGSNAINDIQVDFEGNVWAVAATNTILKESTLSRGTFDGLVGPSGGGAFTSIAIARDGYVYAGNGQSIFVSTNEAASTGGWSSLKDFGSNHIVTRIQCVDGESQILRALVGDGTGFEGDVWYSLDGGNSWVEVTNLTNLNYNDWYISEVDPNLLFIAGEDDATNGVVHKLAPG